MSIKSSSSNDDAVRKWSLFILSFITVSLSSGLIYGWPSLRRNLIEVSNTTLTEEQLGALYTIGAWSTQGGRFLFGLARDKFGTKITCLVALLGVIGGCIGVAVCDANNVVSLSISVFCIGLGSGGQLCLQPVASLFTRSGTIIASLSGAFQVSGLMFLAVLSITSIRMYAFLGLAAVICVLSVFAGFMLPKGPSFAIVIDGNNNNDATIDNEAKDDNVTIDKEEVMVNEEQVLPNVEEEKEEYEENINVSALPSPPPTIRDKLDRLKTILIQKEYIALLIWFSTCIIPLQYYVGTIGLQLELLGDYDGYYTGLFSIIYASAASLAPFGGYLADRLGLGLTQGLATSLSAASFYILAVGNLKMQVPGMCLYSVGRMLIFGMYFANIGKRFGFQNYGLMAGLGLMLSAIISLAQYPLISAAISGKARQVNLICGSVLLLIGIPYCLWLGLTREKRQQSENVESEQSATKRRMTLRARQPSLFRSSLFRSPSFFQT